MADAEHERGRQPEQPAERARGRPQQFAAEGEYRERHGGRLGERCQSRGEHDLAQDAR
jgi:hypothetical protein